MRKTNRTSLKIIYILFLLFLAIPIMASSTAALTISPTGMPAKTLNLKNLACDKKIIAPSAILPDFPDEAAVDCDENTAWGYFGDSPFILVDLEDEYKIDNITIKWLDPFSSPSYSIAAFTNDGLFVQEIIGNGGTEKHSLSSNDITARYVGMFSTNPFELIGVSEFEVWGKTDEISSEIWASKGNGVIIELNGDKYKWYEVTKISRLPHAEGIVEDRVLYYNGYEVGDLENLLKMGNCYKIDKLPEVSVEEYTDDPEVNFEVFWSTFEQSYSLFNLMTETTWKELHDKYRYKITQDTTDDELWNILSKMIKPLNDGHTQLVDPEEGRRVESKSEPSPSSWMMENYELYTSTIISYLDSFSREDNEAGNGNISYGTIDDKIGYINILSYAGYGEEPMNAADTSMPYSLHLARSDREYFSQIIDNIFGQFSHMEALIIDLRFNGGGFDKLPQELLNRLIPQRRLAYSHHSRIGGYEEFGKLIMEYSEPEGTVFLNRPVIVLTSNLTASNGEIQAMLLKDLPNVTLMGETTFGIFSTMLFKKLPNRWIFSLSTDRTYSASGELYEQTGISPHIEVRPDKGQLLKGYDNMLDAAIEHLETQL